MSKTKPKKNTRIHHKIWSRFFLFNELQIHMPFIDCKSRPYINNTQLQCIALFSGRKWTKLKTISLANFYHSNTLIFIRRNVIYVFTFHNPFSEYFFAFFPSFVRRYLRLKATYVYFMCMLFEFEWTNQKRLLSYSLSSSSGNQRSIFFALILTGIE